MQTVRMSIGMRIYAMLHYFFYKVDLYKFLLWDCRLFHFSVRCHLRQIDIFLFQFLSISASFWPFCGKFHNVSQSAFLCNPPLPMCVCLSVNLSLSLSFCLNHTLTYTILWLRGVRTACLWDRLSPGGREFKAWLCHPTTG